MPRVGGAQMGPDSTQRAIINIAFQPRISRSSERDGATSRILEAVCPDNASPGSGVDETERVPHCMTCRGAGRGAQHGLSVRRWMGSSRGLSKEQDLPKRVPLDNSSVGDPLYDPIQHLENADI